MNTQLRYFRSLPILTSLIDEYFTSVGIDTGATSPKVQNNTESLKSLRIKTSVAEAEPDPPTITGLALHLGFNSLKEFEQYEKAGRFASRLKRARLLITAAYEKKLHNSHHGGAVFALKEMGWHDRPDERSQHEDTPVITIKIIESGPEPVSAEKDIPL
jgi:hypothetical protein